MPTISEYRSWLGLPQVRAALDTIAWAEGANYNTLYGGGTFSDFSRHPNRRITAGGYTSTAAGRYQFLYSTWQGLGLPDFSPVNQDIGALMLIARRGALSQILQGDFHSALTSGALGKEWASLPYSPYGQTNRTVASVMNKFNSSLGSPANVSLPANLSGATGLPSFAAAVVAGLIYLILDVE
jgi:muramidase (phage lysozyme)